MQYDAKGPVVGYSWAPRCGVQHDAKEEPVLVSSSFFMSNVARIRGPDPELLPPGPAYYNPDSVSKKSFHLNARQRWL